MNPPNFVHPEDKTAALYQLLYGRSTDPKNLIVPDVVKTKVINAVKAGCKYQGREPKEEELLWALEWASETLISFYLLEGIQLGLYDICFVEGQIDPWFKKSNNNSKKIP